MAIRGGVSVDLLNPLPHNFQPEAVARTLANIARFAGNHGSYTVAQHAVLTAVVCGRHFNGNTAQLLAALHHDDVEAITNDIPKPVKRVCPDVGVLEDRLNAALNARYQIDIHDPLVKQAEYVVFASEVLRLVPQGERYIYRDDVGAPPRFKLTWTEMRPWSADEAFCKYMDLHDSLAAQHSNNQIVESKLGGLQ